MPNPEGTKALIVDEEIHERIKKLAKIRRMPIKWYVEYLIELDEDIYDEEVLKQTNRPKRKNNENA